ncbi:hypothetical protein [Streptomyces sp. NBC_01614]|uniref:hypothetical protein n=1 Tax=Streptomyces sp. NBC_01614 TaxID=2975897 RepID=UPI0038670F9C
MDPLGEDGNAQDGSSHVQATVALEGGGATIAQARHLAVSFLSRRRAGTGCRCRSARWN